MIIKNRKKEYNKGLITVATGEYNDFIPALINSSKTYFPCHIYLFTDRPKDYEHFNDITIIEMEHYGWPKMPLLRFEMLYKHKDLFKENYSMLFTYSRLFHNFSWRLNGI